MTRLTWRSGLAGEVTVMVIGSLSVRPSMMETEVPGVKPDGVTTGTLAGRPPARLIEPMSVPSMVAVTLSSDSERPISATCPPLRVARPGMAIMAERPARLSLPLMSLMWA